MSRPESGRLRRAFLLSGVVHVALVGMVWAFASRETRPQMRVYAVNIVSMPPQQLGEPRPDPPVPLPEAEPEPEEPEPEPEPAPPPPPPPPPQQAAPPQRTPPRQEQPRPTPPPERQPETPPRQAAPPPSTGARPDPSSPGGENINLRLQGVQCPSAEYCENIVRQLYRYFRFSGSGGGVAEVFFVINRDGSISELRPERSTGSAAFRLAALEAVEQAGRNQAFGPLPQAFGGDRLPVIFTFSPAR